MSEKKLKRVEVLPGCISCGTCAVICPDVFKIDSVSEVKQGADIVQNQDCIEEAAEMCPVRVIKLEFDD